LPSFLATNLANSSYSSFESTIRKQFFFTLLADEFARTTWRSVWRRDAAGTAVLYGERFDWAARIVPAFRATVHRSRSGHNFKEAIHFLFSVEATET
jgi:hypothetical protein